jgi:hypothetical protein
MMASIGILVFSLLTLFMFFVSYCRSLMASSARHQLSEEVRDVAGIKNPASAGDYTRITQLLQLCPERPEDRTGLRAVSVYYGFLDLAQHTLSRIVPSVREWLEREQAGCAYFAAVTLDRRISFSRELLAQQVES